MNRTELTLGQIGEVWRLQPRGEQFTQALLSFFRSLGSHDTLQTYAFAILQLFAWYWQRHRSLVTPDRITRGDAAEYNRWLRTRDMQLTRFWLERDPERQRDLQIYDFIGKNPGSSLEQLSRRFGIYTNEDKVRFASHLACLVKRRILARTPTIAEYRREHGGAIVEPPDDLYRYTIPMIKTPAGPDRAANVGKNLSAIS